MVLIPECDKHLLHNTKSLLLASFWTPVHVLILRRCISVILFCGLLSALVCGTPILGWIKSSLSILDFEYSRENTYL